MQYIFVYYVYEANSVLVKHTKIRNDESFVEAYKEMYEELKAKDFKPQPWMQQTTSALKQYKDTSLHKMYIIN